MLFYKKVFDFYIKSSLHLGFCVVSLYLVSIFKQQITVNHYVLICLFSSTIIVYKIRVNSAVLFLCTKCANKKNTNTKFYLRLCSFVFVVFFRLENFIFWIYSFFNLSLICFSIKSFEI